MIFTARHAALAALLALSGLAHHSAHAQSGYASFELSHVSLAAVDLDPLDATAPALTFSELSYTTNLRIDASQSTLATIPGVSDGFGPSSSVVPALHRAYDAGGVSGSADVVPGATSNAPFDLSLRAGLSFVGATQPYTAQSSLGLAIQPFGDFMGGDFPVALTLSAHTQLRVTGQLDMHVDGQSTFNVGGVAGQAGYHATFEMNLFSFSDAGFGESASDQEYLFEKASVQNVSRAVLLTLDNNTDADMTVYVGIGGGVAANGLVSSVPEPQSLALGLAGLLIVCGARRLRQH